MEILRADLRALEADLNQRWGEYRERMGRVDAAVQAVTARVGDLRLEQSTHMTGLDVTFNRRMDTVENHIGNLAKTAERTLEQAIRTNGRVEAHTDDIKDLEARLAHLAARVEEVDLSRRFTLKQIIGAVTSLAITGAGFTAMATAFHWLA